MFGDGIVTADSPEDFSDKVNHYLDNPLERQSITLKGHNCVKQNHTGFHRIAQILKELGFETVASDVLSKYKESING